MNLLGCFETTGERVSKTTVLPPLSSQLWSRKMAEITEAQKAELKRLCKEARVPDMSDIVTTSEEAERRIRDLKEKARTE